jgi:hypothetical protein
MSNIMKKSDISKYHHLKYCHVLATKLLLRLQVIMHFRSSDETVKC